MSKRRAQALQDKLKSKDQWLAGLSQNEIDSIRRLGEDPETLYRKLQKQTKSELRYPTSRKVIMARRKRDGKG